MQPLKRRLLRKIWTACALVVLLVSLLYAAIQARTSTRDTLDKQLLTIRGQLNDIRVLHNAQREAKSAVNEWISAHGVPPTSLRPILLVLNVWAESEAAVEQFSATVQGKVASGDVSTFTTFDVMFRLPHDRDLARLMHDMESQLPSYAQRQRCDWSRRFGELSSTGNLQVLCRYSVLLREIIA